MYIFSSSNQRHESLVPIYQDYCFQGIMLLLEMVRFLLNRQSVFLYMGLLPMLGEKYKHLIVNIHNYILYNIPYPHKIKPILKYYTLSNKHQHQGNATKLQTKKPTETDKKLV